MGDGVFSSSSQTGFAPIPDLRGVEWLLSLHGAPLKNFDSECTWYAEYNHKLRIWCSAVLWITLILMPLFGLQTSNA